jgi:sporulation protein YlmC with PRC-barrel domain
VNSLSVFRRSMLVVAMGAAVGTAAAQEATPIVEATPAWRLQQQAETNAAHASAASHARMADAYSMKRLMGADVRGSDGKKLGEVSNFIVGADGRVKSVVASSSGFLGIGKTRFVVPWQEARVYGPALQSIDVPATKDSLARSSAFDDDNLKLPVNSLRGSELVGEWISLQNGQMLGRVSDLLIGRDGRMEYVVVSGDSRQDGRTYAYPYRARGADSAYVGVPFERPTPGDLMPFDYAQIERGAPVATRR